MALTRLSAPRGLVVGRGLIVLASLLSMSACAPATVRPASDTPALRSEQTRGSLTTWTLKGRLQTPEQRANLRWRQQDAIFDVLLRGPFGLGSVRLTGTPEQVEIFEGDSSTISANPVQDIWQRTGLYVPVAALPYWLRGVPAPFEPAALTRDVAGQISRIEQAGWQIDCSDYRAVDGTDFPHHINLVNAPWEMTVEISKWQDAH